MQPEARYWRNSRFHGSFFPAHLFGGQFNTTLRGARRQGWFAGLGIGYGYAWHFARHWGLEAEIAVGYAYYGYDKYPCADCGRKLGTRHKNYVGPTKAALNLVYYFGGTPKLIAKPEEPLPEPIPQPEPVPVKPVFVFETVDIPQSRVLTENLDGVAKVQFHVGKTDINPALANNAAELNGIVSRLDSLVNDLDMQITSIELVGYASPEGKYSNNERLARGRTAALMDYINGHADLPAAEVAISNVPEDWEGLEKAVVASNYPDREALLDIIRSGKAPDDKEAALRRHKASWANILADVMPSLRRTQYRINYRHTYTEQETQTLQAVNDALLAGDADLAARLLVDIPSSPEADYSRGLVCLLQDRYDEAMTWLRRAQQRGVKAATPVIEQLQEVTNGQPSH